MFNVTAVFRRTQHTHRANVPHWLSEGDQTHTHTNTCTEHTMASTADDKPKGLFGKMKRSITRRKSAVARSAATAKKRKPGGKRLNRRASLAIGSTGGGGVARTIGVYLLDHSKVNVQVKMSTTAMEICVQIRRKVHHKLTNKHTSIAQRGSQP